MKKLLLSLAAVIVTTSCASNSNIVLTNTNDQVNALANTNYYDDNKVTLLVDGGEIFSEIFNVIDSAKKKIYVSTYLFGGTVGDKIAEKLIEKKKQGLEIQFVAEGSMGSIPELVKAAKKSYKYMSDNGVEVRIFPTDLMPPGPTFLSNRKIINHSKLVVVDDYTAIVGGMNFKETEVVNHDFMLKIQGSKVKEFSKITDLDWKNSRKMSIKAVNLRTNDIEVSQTGFKEQNIDEMLLKYIDQASTSIDIEMLLIDHQQIVKALVAAKDRGVNVRIILDQADLGKYNKWLEALPIEGMANFGAALSLSQAGIPLKWYVPKSKEQVLHAKTLLIDKKVFITGSANLTYHALTRNHEVAVAVHDAQVAARFSQVFEEDWKSNGKNIELSKTQKTLGKLFQQFGKWVYTKSEEQFLSDVPNLRSILNEKE